MNVRAHLEVLEQVVHTRIDIQRVEPEREHARLALALGIKVLNDRSLVLLERFEARPGVEEVGDKGEVELGVACDERGRREVLAAADRVGVLQDLRGRGVSATSVDGDDWERTFSARVWRSRSCSGAREHSAGLSWLSRTV